MTQDYKHPITPPPELVQQWASEWMQQQSLNRDNFMATRASQYGSDQELEACCEWLDKEGWSGESRQLRAARRPKPPSLKEQALDAHNRMMAGEETQDDWAIVRRALEQLPDPS
jgi:hypothetical protein